MRGLTGNKQVLLQQRAARPYEAAAASCRVGAVQLPCSCGVAAAWAHVTLPPTHRNGQTRQRPWCPDALYACKQCSAGWGADAGGLSICGGRRARVQRAGAPTSTWGSDMAAGGAVADATAAATAAVACSGAAVRGAGGHSSSLQEAGAPPHLSRPNARALAKVAPPSDTRKRANASAPRCLTTVPEPLDPFSCGFRAGPPAPRAPEPRSGPGAGRLRRRCAVCFAFQIVELFKKCPSRTVTAPLGARWDCGARRQDIFPHHRGYRPLLILGPVPLCF